jgi:hypothetical protein
MDQGLSLPEERAHQTSCHPTARLHWIDCNQLARELSLRPPVRGFESNGHDHKTHRHVRAADCTRQKIEGCEKASTQSVHGTRLSKARQRQKTHTRLCKERNLHALTTRAFSFDNESRTQLAATFCDAHQLVISAFILSRRASSPPIHIEDSAYQGPCNFEHFVQRNCATHALRVRHHTWEW